MDHGFIRASTSDYSKPNSETDRVVVSFDGYVAYLIIADEASWFVWVFLRKSKEPPIDLVSHFLQMYGRQSGGVIRCDQGGDLAKSELFRTTMMEKHSYVIEPTGADSRSQNIGVENGTIPLLLQPAHSCTDQPSRLNIGRLSLFMRHTSITVGYTMVSCAHLSSNGMVENRTYVT